MNRIDNPTIRVRFCPSPTGYMHLGNARAALFNALFAAKLQGRFLLRIEDTDKVRSEEHYVQALCDDLAWLGLQWWGNAQQVVGQLRPLDYQANRLSIYQTYYQRLLKQGRAYPCFCDQATLEEVNRRQRAASQPARYSGVCQDLSDEEIAAHRAVGRRSVLRFHVEDDQLIKFNDLIYGEQVFHGRNIGDFIIQRTDQNPSFIFCNALDDAHLKISHILRGEDHLSNTARQMMVQQALGFKSPVYAHLPLITRIGGQVLSKREGSVSIQELRQKGFLPQAIINYLARLGHRYDDQENLLTWQQLAQGFSTEKISRSPACFHEKHLLYWQRKAVAALDEVGLQHLLAKNLKSLSVTEQLPFIRFIKGNISLPQDAEDLLQACYAEQLVFDTETLLTFKQMGLVFWGKAIHLLEEATDFSTWQRALQQATGLSGKQLFKPLRMALTGLNDGPKLGELMQLRGQAWFKQRLQAVLEQSDRFPGQ